jgi:LPS O-antigen subunit length determinant protein (WzzB/FepE family)
MNTFNASLPPHTDPATIVLAAQLLAVLSDPEGSKAQLQRLADATDALRAAAADASTAKAEADASVADLASLQADKASFEAKKAEHQQAVLALQVASEANSRRSKELDELERTIAAQTADLQRRISTHDARVKEFRDMLAG